MATHPDRYEKTSGTGCLILFGLPFFLMGLGAIWAAATGNMRDGSGEPAPMFVGILFGSVFASIGAGFIFGRSGFHIDKRSGQVVKWWGLLVPMKKTVLSLDAVTQVSLAKEIRRSDKSSWSKELH